MILHDERGGRTLALGEREWGVLSGMDGTRDLVGLCEHAGGRVSLAHVEAFAAQLASLGLLDDPLEPEPEPDPSEIDAYPADLPIRALPGYRFRCDGRGACCRLFPTLLFTPLETARARAAAPDVLGGGQHPAGLFMPERGLDDTLSAVAQIDGRCAFLAEDGRCRIHAAAGEEAKPFGCRTFPIRAVDVGEEIRVAPRLECACVFASATDPAGREALTAAARGGELAPETHVPRLADPVRMGPDTVAARDFLAWCDGLRQPTEGEDAAAWCAALAHEVGSNGLAARSASSQGELRSEELRRELVTLGETVHRFSREHAGWRAPDDLVRRGAAWLGEALGEALARLSSADRLGAGPNASDPEHERFALRVTLFAGDLARGSSVEGRLRELGALLLAARAFPPEAAVADPAAARHPLALVCALVRGHGLSSEP